MVAGGVVFDLGIIIWVMGGAPWCRNELIHVVLSSCVAILRRIQ